MAGKEYGKHKTIAIYDYFKQNVSTDENNGGVTVENIRDYLRSVFGDDFERKSIYSDLNVINEYKRKINGNDEDWIVKTGRSNYKRTLEKEDFTMDEVHLLLDAVNATPICEESIAVKLKKHFPTYFKNDDYISFLACERQKPSRAFITLMNRLRRAIKEKQAIKIMYGYKLTDQDIRNCYEKERKISPIALYFDENKYYLFALDNDKYKKYIVDNEERIAKLKALRQFRIDRISTAVNFMGVEKYIDCDINIVKEKIAGSVDAYSSGKNVDVKMTIEGDPELVIRAFDFLRNEISVKTIISDGWQGGKLSFFVNVSPTPRLFSLMMNLSSFASENASGVKITMDVSNEFKEAYEEFLENSKKNINFITPS